MVQQRAIAQTFENAQHVMEVVMEVNSDRLNAFMGKMVTEFGAAMNASLVLLGDKLGLYRALAAKGPMNSSELASATGTNGALCPRMAGEPGGVRLRRIRFRFAESSRCCRSRRWRWPTRTARSSSARSAMSLPRRFSTSRKFRTHSSPARASAGTGAASACSAAPPASSAPATCIIWCRSGCPRSTASWTS